MFSDITSFGSLNTGGGRVKLTKDTKSLLYSLSILIISAVAIITLGLIPGIGAAIGVAQATKGDV
jgi:hypothetical protein